MEDCKNSTNWLVWCEKMNKTCRCGHHFAVHEDECCTGGDFEKPCRCRVYSEGKREEAGVQLKLGEGEFS